MRRPRPGTEAEARARVEAVFAGFDRLTPDELAHIGLRRAESEHRAALLETVETVARAADRGVLLGEARAGARDAVLRRYAAGQLHPTWVGLNWGLSQGTTGDRVAIVDALADAAAAAVVSDLVEPEVVDALTIDAEHVVAMARGEVSEGSLAHAIEPPPPGMHDTRGHVGAVVVGAMAVGIVAYSAAALTVGFEAGLATALVLGGLVVILGRRSYGGDADTPRDGDA